MLAAIASLGGPFERDELPDTGELRSDLMAVVASPWLGGTERRVRTLAGLTSVIDHVVLPALGLNHGPQNVSRRSPDSS